MRLDQTESSRLVWALIISLGLHLLFFASFEIGASFGWWQRLPLPAWLQKHGKLAQVLTERKRLHKPPPDSQIPLVFVEVSPEQATLKAPKNAKYYSNKNSLAGNPQTEKDLDVPKINGTQTEEIKTENVPNQKKFTPLQPLPPSKPKPADQQVTKTAPPKAKPPKAPPPKPMPSKQPPEPDLPQLEQPPGDLAMVNPQPPPREEARGEEPHSPPSTIREALEQRHPDLAPGQKMKQEGGVKQYLELGSLDAKGSELGQYDQQLIAAIKEHWYDLLDQRAYASDARGKVVLQFCLHADGSVTDLHIAHNTVGLVLGDLCRRAVWDPSPFAKWPARMRAMMGDTRNVQFTFYYN
jgi:outer membrane biosynthesis protein TonB